MSDPVQGSTAHRCTRKRWSVQPTHFVGVEQDDLPPKHFYRRRSAEKFAAWMLRFGFHCEVRAMSDQPGSAATDMQAMAETLAAAGYRVQAPPPPPPVNHCHVCGKTDDENRKDGFGPLVDVLVIIADGEEGAAYPRRYFCNEHLDGVCKGLIGLGFGVHRHGGINFLEPENCPGFHDMDACPTPVDDEDGGYEND